MRIQRISSKWEKTKVLNRNEQLRVYIPDTRPFSPEQLESMLEEYDMVYVKPDRGTFGNGVMSAERYRENEEEDSPWIYKLRFGIESIAFQSVQELLKTLAERIDKRPYLIQQGISMITHENRKFDLRVLVQKTPRGNWETTGYIGRVAAKQKIVTNHHNGGMVLSIEELLNDYLNGKELAEFIRNLRGLGERVGWQLQKKYPNLKEIGLDVAIDEDYWMWVLEVNTLPALFPFKWLKDKSIYKKIREYAVAYGRLSGKKKTS
ncbi:YheC/YheD family protein [Paenibacillus caui]|uniref:YheC/YheD family protein n=1 Tax=Paenibacillus caui TaxID=2873927 RepID=UPI001CA90A7C|nr:YheC/YheD family protein [Paenibacillus caui]